MAKLMFHSVKREQTHTFQSKLPVSTAIYKVKILLKTLFLFSKKFFVEQYSLSFVKEVLRKCNVFLAVSAEQSDKLCFLIIIFMPPD